MKLVKVKFQDFHRENTISGNVKVAQRDRLHTITLSNGHFLEKKIIIKIQRLIENSSKKAISKKITKRLLKKTTKNNSQRLLDYGLNGRHVTTPPGRAGLLAFRTPAVSASSASSPKSSMGERSLGCSAQNWLKLRMLPSIMFFSSWLR